MKNILDTGNYFAKLRKKVDRIEKNAGRNIRRRYVLLLLMLLVCIGGLYFGVTAKRTALEAQYQIYRETHNQAILDEELLDYKDTYFRFITDHLGNTPNQSLMGGFFYSGVGLSVYPDKDTWCTVINEKDSERILSDHLVDNINVRGSKIIYRDPETRSIVAFDTETNKAEILENRNVGQMIVCGSDYYYIDLISHTLFRYSCQDEETVEVLETFVTSFAVIGNKILYLDSDNCLRSYSMNDESDMTISKNVTAFSYNGSLLIQHNNKLYQGKLSEKSYTQIDLKNECRRLLGATETKVLFEGSNSTYSFDLNNDSYMPVSEGVFRGASDQWMISFIPEKQEYAMSHIY